MTCERRYKLVCDMLRDYCMKDYGNTELAKKVILDPHMWQCDSSNLPFYAYASELLIDAKAGMDKATTPKQRLAVLNRVVKNAPREDFRGIFKSGERWAVSDAYRFIRINERPLSIPEVKNDIDLDRIIPKNTISAETVELPNVADIRAFMATNKIKSGRYISYNPIEAVPGWWCNPSYLLDMVQALPGGKAYKPANHYSPLYYQSDDGDALLCAVRHAA